MIMFERIQYQQRTTESLVVNDVSMGSGNQHNMNANTRPDIEANTNIEIGDQRHNQIKLLLFLIDIIINIIFSISLMVFIYQ